MGPPVLAWWCKPSPLGPGQPWRDQLRGPAATGNLPARANLLTAQLPSESPGPAFACTACSVGARPQLWPG
jgi:hypothetical protein